MEAGKILKKKAAERSAAVEPLPYFPKMSWMAIDGTVKTGKAPRQPFPKSGGTPEACRERRRRSLRPVRQKPAAIAF